MYVVAVRSCKKRESDNKREEESRGIDTCCGGEVRQRQGTI